MLFRMRSAMTREGGLSKFRRELEKDKEGNLRFSESGCFMQTVQAHSSVFKIHFCCVEQRAVFILP